MLTEAPLCCTVKQSECKGITHNVERPLAATGTRGEDVLCHVTNMVPSRKGCMRVCVCACVMVSGETSLELKEFS